MKLSDHQKYFVVQSLARWRSPQQVVDLVAAEWPETKGQLDRMQVHKYDPTGARCEVAQKWQDLFWETREKFQKAADEIAVAQPAYRLQILSDMVDRALASRNMVLAAQLLEQAAKEVGGMYTNKRVLGGAVGYFDMSRATDEQLDAICAGADPKEVLGDE